LSSGEVFYTARKQWRAAKPRGADRTTEITL